MASARFDWNPEKDVENRISMAFHLGVPNTHLPIHNA